MARNKTTSLWSLVDKMQRRLENEGLHSDVVDVAVTRGLEVLLGREPRKTRDVARLAGVFGGPALVDA